VLGTVLVGVGAGGARSDAKSLYNPALKIEVGVYDGKHLTIKGPEMTLNSWGQFNYTWSDPSSEYSSHTQYTLFHYYGGSSNSWNWDAAVFIVNPEGKVRRLANDKVRLVKFSDDGRHLIGIGNNTLRVWDLTGSVRLKSFDYIETFTIKSNTLCMEAVEWPKTGYNFLASFVVRHYKLPGLELLSSKPKYNDKSQYINSCMIELK
jgi:hypothetical protein